MTGFGKEVLQIGGRKITIEIKSLNSKQADLNLRMPTLLRSKEGELRKAIVSALQRGKIDCSFYVEVVGLENAPRINQDLALAYLKQLKALADESGTEGDLIGSVMRLPDVIQSSEDELSDAEWKALEASLQNALQKIMQFRADEGASLQKDLEDRLNNIRAYLEEVPALEEERTQRVREKLQRSLDQLKADADADRFEQELIYYLEKLDVTEEKVRLAAHLSYFQELMNQGGSQGKKLGFVAQEIGREINTLGSKANHAGMQRLVVQMKDELEKIKEQSLNIL